jgi:hypothetical protein
MSISVAHVLVRHRMLIFVAKILWSTTHAPQNTYIGAPQMSFSLLVMLHAFGEKWLLVPCRRETEQLVSTLFMLGEKILNKQTI